MDNHKPSVEREIDDTLAMLKQVLLDYHSLVNNNREVILSMATSITTMVNNPIYDANQMIELIITRLRTVVNSDDSSRLLRKTEAERGVARERSIQELRAYMALYNKQLKDYESEGE